MYFFAEVVTPSVTAFDEIVNSNVSKFVELSNKIQGDVHTLVSVWDGSVRSRMRKLWDGSLRSRMRELWDGSVKPRMRELWDGIDTLGLKLRNYGIEANLIFFSLQILKSNIYIEYKSAVHYIQIIHFLKSFHF